MGDRSAPDLGSLAGAHREAWLPSSGRVRTVSVLALAVVTVALVGLGTVLVVAEGADVVWRLLPNLATVLVVALVSRRGVDLGPEGVRPRHGVVRRRWRPWTDVVEVRPAGRWEQRPVAVLDHERLDLRGLTSEDAVRLAAALVEARDGRDEPDDARDRRAAGPP